MPISKVRKFIADGVFYAELNEFLVRALGKDGYTGVEIRRTPLKTEIVIRATRTQNVLGENGRRIRELTALIESRFNLPAETVVLYAEPIRNRALSAIAQAEAIHLKLTQGLVVRRACHGVMKYVMESGALGLEIVISGKLRQARAKAMKFRDGYMIKSGDNLQYYVDKAVRHLKLKSGTLGIYVKIMKPHDPTGRNGVAVKRADVVKILDINEKAAGKA